MSYHFTPLSSISWEEIHTSMVEAFADYAVDLSYMTQKVLENRSAKNGYDPEASIGAFFNHKLVGHTLVGVTEWQQHLIGFDIGTGIIKEHRGKGVAGKMFDASLPVMKVKGIERFYLEVLTVNDKAIRAYEKSGFSITREFVCYTLKRGDFKLAFGNNESIEIKRSEINCLDDFVQHLDWIPSFENSFESIRMIPDELHCLVAYLDGKEAGLLVYYPGLNWIMSLVVHREHRKKGIANQLLHHLWSEVVPADHEMIKLINVDKIDKNMNSYLKSVGCAVIVGQYEMMLEL